MDMDPWPRGKPRISKELELTITKEIITKKLHNKSPGPDNLHPKIFNEVAQVIVEPLFIIFNLPIQLNKIPAGWKSASITPIYENKGDKHIAENYRQVNLYKYWTVLSMYPHCDCHYHQTWQDGSWGQHLPIRRSTSNVYNVVWLFLNLFLRTNVSILPQIFV